MQPDTKVDCSSASVVTLAGAEWFIAPLAPRQARKVIPALMKLLPKLAALETSEEGEDKLAALAALDEQSFEGLIDVVQGALTRAYPTLTRDEFLDLPISTSELIAAVGSVIKQSGLSQPGADAGEAQGETAPASPAPLETSTI